MSQNRSHHITIEKMITGGYGLGRLPDGMVVQVPLVIPGENVSVEPVHSWKKHVFARLLEVITPSPHRVGACCPVFGKCGGCDLEHIDYDFQMTLKAMILRESLQRAGLDEKEIERVWTAPLASPDSYGYRTRIRLHVDRQRRVPGFHRFHSNIVEPVSCCALALPGINEVLGRINKNSQARQLFDHTATVEIIASLADQAVVLNWSLARKPRAGDRKAALRICEEVAGIKSIFYSAPESGMVGPIASQGNEVDRYVRFSLPEKVIGRVLLFTYEAGGFSQVNHRQNENLVGLLNGWASVTSDMRVLDLFCGMGNFSLPLALRAKEVVGMDIQNSAIRSAKRNAELNYIRNCRFVKSLAGDGIRSFNAKDERFDLILLDPPRQGCAEIIPELLKSRAARIIYISCDPATLARDLALLQKAYRLQKIKLVDMFPQTHHMETIALLERT